MRNFLILAVSAATIAAAGVAIAQPAPSRIATPAESAPAATRVSRHLDPAQREARRHAAFERLDSDHNGTVTFAEFSATHPRARSGEVATRGDHPRRARGTSAPRGSALDADGDGTVTREEYTAAMEKRFDRLDADHDGRLSLDERRPGGRRASPTTDN